jgi:hypothetical protein
MITPTAHEKAQWALHAQACYARGDSAMGHRYSAKAALPEGARLEDSVFDTLQRNMWDQTSEARRSA